MYHRHAHLLALLAIAAVALGPAAAASAKEIASVKVCGADGCHDVTDRATHGRRRRRTAHRVRPTRRRRSTGSRSRSRPRAAESVPGWSYLWVPAAELLRGDDGTWMTPAEHDRRRAEGAHARDRAAARDQARAARARRGAAADGRRGPGAAARDGGGPPTAVWVFIAAGALGLASRCSRAPRRPPSARRGGSAPAGVVAPAAGEA